MEELSCPKIIIEFSPQSHNDEVCLNISQRNKLIINHNDAKYKYRAGYYNGRIVMVNNIKKTNKLIVIFLSGAAFNLAPVFGSQNQTEKRLGYQAQMLQGAKQQSNLSVDDEISIKQKGKARSIGNIGRNITSTTDKISGTLASSNFLTNIIALSPVPLSLAAIGLLNNIVGVVGKGVEVYALRKDALADMAFGKLADLNDINEATKTLEKIEALREIEGKMGGQKTIKRAIKESPNVSKGKKLSIYLNPSHLKNTIKRLTDDLHITNNQTKIEQNLATIRGEIKKEEDNFDNIIRKLQARFLNRLILDFKDALDKVKKVQEGRLNQNDYRAQLQKDITEAKKVQSSLQSEVDNLPRKSRKKGVLPITQGKGPEDRNARKARQMIYINKIKGRLSLFEETLKKPDEKRIELEELKKELLALTSQKPNSAVTTGENTQKFEERLKKLEQEVSVLENERLKAKPHQSRNYSSNPQQQPLPPRMLPRIPPHNVEMLPGMRADRPPEGF